MPAISSLDRHDEYEQAALDRSDLDADPIVQFRRWLAEAEAAALPDPNALVLSTVGPSGPTSRTVLLKALVGGAFGFATNGDSRKGVALAADGRVALLFPWYPLQRQVLVDGDAAPAPTDLSDDYWASRPRASQLSAWASRQSSPIGDRAALEEQAAEAEARFAGSVAVPRPPHWGAWLVRPRRIEFWQGRRSRLHDRFVYTPDGDGWAIERLQP